MYYILIFLGAIYNLITGLASSFESYLYPSQHTEGRLAKSSKEGKSLAFWIQFCRSLCIRARSFSYFSKCYLSIFLHCQVDNKEWHIYISITLIILKYSCFLMLWFNQEKIYFCHHLSCVFLKGFINNIVTLMTLE